MPVSDFAKFVESQQVDNSMKQSDLNEMRNEWLHDLDLFYEQVASFLSDYVQAGSIAYDFTEILLTEENIESYLVKKMNIRIGRQRVSLEPVGTLLIGSKGRIDAIGTGGRAQIVMVNKNVRSAQDLIRVTVSVGGKASPSSIPPPVPALIEWGWKIVTRTPNRQFVSLNKESFFDLLMEVAGA